MAKVPLTYKGVVIGEAEAEFRSDGVYVVGEIHDNEVAREVLGETVSHVSFGFNADGIDFSDVKGSVL